MDIEQFKNALMKTIYQHLHANSQDEIFYLLLDKHSEAYALELTSTQWRLIPSHAPSNEKIRDKLPLKPVYNALLKAIIQAEQGYDLWQEIQEQANNMPGWWQFFAPLRPLHMALNEVLKEFRQPELKQEDDAVFRRKIKALIDEVKDLLKRITNLVQKCDFLEAQLKENTCNKVIIKELQIQYKQIEDERDQILKDFIDLQNTYETEMENHTTEAKALKEVIGFLREEINTLKQTMSTHRLIGCDEMDTPEPPRGHIYEGDSQEIMRRHNANYGRNRHGFLSPANKTDTPEPSLNKAYRPN